MATSCWVFPLTQIQIVHGAPVIIHVPQSQNCSKVGSQPTKTDGEIINCNAPFWRIISCKLQKTSYTVIDQRKWNLIQYSFISYFWEQGIRRFLHLCTHRWWQYYNFLSNSKVYYTECIMHIANCNVERSVLPCHIGNFKTVTATRIPLACPEFSILFQERVKIRNQLCFLQFQSIPYN